MRSSKESEDASIVHGVPVRCVGGYAGYPADNDSKRKRAKKGTVVSLGVKSPTKRDGALKYEHQAVDNKGGNQDKQGNSENKPPGNPMVVMETMGKILSQKVEMKREMEGKHQVKEKGEILGIDKLTVSSKNNPPTSFQDRSEEGQLSGKATPQSKLETSPEKGKVKSHAQALQETGMKVEIPES